MPPIWQRNSMSFCCHIKWRNLYWLWHFKCHLWTKPIAIAKFVMHPSVVSKCHEFARLKMKCRWQFLDCRIRLWCSHKQAIFWWRNPLSWAEWDWVLMISRVATRRARLWLLQSEGSPPRDAARTEMPPKDSPKLRWGPRMARCRIHATYNDKPLCASQYVGGLFVTRHS